MKIFLSHKSRDKPLVNAFKNQFPGFIEFWLDEESLDMGGLLEKSIRTAIENDVDFFMAFIGEDTLKSDWIIKELGWALEREDDPDVPFFLPILMGDWSRGEIPEFISGKRYLSLNNYESTSIKALAEEAQRQLFAIVSKDWSRKRVKTPPLPQTTILRDQASANDFIKQHIDYSKIRRATVIQYSSDQAKSAIEHLLRSGIAVDLYIKDPETAISDLQRSKIDSNMRTYLDIWKRGGSGYHELRVAFYRDIGTVRGFRFDDDSILIGVYHYTKDVIWGHDIPTFYCPPGSEHVEAVLERFDSYLLQLEKSELEGLAHYESHGYP